MIQYYVAKNFEGNNVVHLRAFDPLDEESLLGCYHFELVNLVTVEKTIKWVADRFLDFAAIDYKDIKTKEIYN